MARRVPDDVSVSSTSNGLVAENVEDLTVEQGPQPGEVWVCVESSYITARFPHSEPHKEQIHGMWFKQPFIVLYISRQRIGIVMANDGAVPQTLELTRGDWNWHEHMTRIWPVVETWEELAQRGVHPDDGSSHMPSDPDEKF